MNGNFCEEYEKSDFLKGTILICSFLFCCFAPLTFIKKITTNNFIIRNIEFVAYGFLFLLSIFLFYKTLISSVYQFKGDKFKGDNLKFSSIATVLVIFLMVLSAILLNKFGITNSNEESLEKASRNGIFTLFVLAVIFLGPIVEELIYRYLLFRFFRRYNIVIAHTLTSIVFAFMHFANDFVKYLDFSLMLNMLPYMFMSLGLSISYEKTKSLVYPIMMHMTINAIATFN